MYEIPVNTFKHRTKRNEEVRKTNSKILRFVKIFVIPKESTAGVYLPLFTLYSVAIFIRVPKITTLKVPTFVFNARKCETWVNGRKKEKSS